MYQCIRENTLIPLGQLGNNLYIRCSSVYISCHPAFPDSHNVCCSITKQILLQEAALLVATQLFQNQINDKTCLNIICNRLRPDCFTLEGTALSIKHWPIEHNKKRLLYAAPLRRENIGYNVTLISICRHLLMFGKPVTLLC